MAFVTIVACFPAPRSNSPCATMARACLPMPWTACSKSSIPCAAAESFVSGDVALCTDGSSALTAAATTLDVEHHAVNRSAGVRVDGDWHVQNINAYHSRLKICSAG